MTIKQQILKRLYKVIMLKGKILPSKNDVQQNTLSTAPNASFYDIEVFANNGMQLNLANYKGKKIIIVNTASNCGFTAQYEELESIYTEYKNKIVVLAFPANDFRNQESGSDASIAQFCSLNFGISFPIMKKNSVIKGDNQQAIYKWLTHKTLNGWCNQPPTWNFCKYIINEHGQLTHFFSNNVAPSSKIFINAIVI